MKKIFYSIILFLMVLVGIFESHKKDNKEYIRSIAEILLQHEQMTGSLPDSIEHALKTTETKLWHRGDVDGNDLIYLKLADEVFVLRSVGKNGTDEKGSGDDIQLIFLRHKEVLREELKNHLKERNPEKWELLENGDFI